MDDEAFLSWLLTYKGGPGSGNFGHAGRPGKVGGSAPDRSGGGSDIAPGKQSDNTEALSPGSKRSVGRMAGAGDGQTASAFFREMVGAPPDKPLLDAYASGTKNAVCRSILKEDPTLTYEDVNGVLAEWADTSSKSVEACDLQEAASLEFGVPLSRYHKQQRETKMDWEVDLALNGALSAETIGLRDSDEKRLIKLSVVFMNCYDLVSEYLDEKEIRAALSMQDRFYKEVGIDYADTAILDFAKSPTDSMNRLQEEIRQLGDALENPLGVTDEEIKFYEKAIKRRRRAIEIIQTREFGIFSESLRGKDSGAIRSLGFLLQARGAGMTDPVFYRPKTYDESLIARGISLDKAAVIRKRFKKDVRKSIEEKSAKMMPIYRKILRAMYNITQREFEKRGITHVTLARGFTRQGSIDVSVGGIFKAISYLGNAIESWSSNRFTAAGFGMHLAVAKIPVKRILCSAVTGLGCLIEDEFVIFGSQGGSVWADIYSADRYSKP